jgi:hypothetical protein
MIVSKKNKIILITPPKTGTHSITQHLKNTGIENETYVNYVQYPIYHLTLSEICNVYNITNNELIDYKILQCVRNPYNRIVSAWRHQTFILNEKIKFIDLLNKVKDHKQLLPNNIDDFYKLFYGSIEHKHKAFRNGNWGGLRFYFEQNWFNDVNADIKYFKLEDLKYSTEELSDYLHIKILKFPHINKNKDGMKESDYKLFYTDVEKSLVNEMYMNDIKLFDYEF